MTRFDDIMREIGGEAGHGGPSSEAFWSSFRAQARLRTQEAPPSPAATALRWAAAASPLAAAAALLVFLRAAPGAWTHGETIVNSLEVEAAHRAVFIMNNAPTKSTIVWVDWGKATPSNGEAL